MAKHFIKPVQLALDHQKPVLWTVTLFPLLAVALIAAFKLAPRLYASLVREDSVVEWATALVYLTTALFAANLSWHFWARSEKLYAVLYGLLTAGLLFVALEEISWGQRQLGFETPAAFTNVNSKHEFNLHNVPVFPLHVAYIAVGLYGAFSRLIANLFLKKNYRKPIELLTPPYIIALYFFIPAAYYIYNQYLYYTVLLPQGLDWSEYWSGEGHFIIGKDQEPLELLLSFGFLMFILLNWVRYRVGAPLSLQWSADPGSHPPPTRRA